jgi:ABC-type phosphate transport system permease subunit
MELLLALILFTGLILCWLVLPGTTTSISTDVVTMIPERNEHSHVSIKQPA